MIISECEDIKWAQQDVNSNLIKAIAKDALSVMDVESEKNCTRRVNKIMEAHIAEVKQ